VALKRFLLERQELAEESRLSAEQQVLVGPVFLV
jgi:hypothetical protein